MRQVFCPTCDELVEDSLDVEPEDIQRIYRAVADGEPQLHLLRLIYDVFREGAYLRPPEDELRLATTCKGGRANG
ncbi:hypothetical protein [Allorhizobium undicola]|uniref:hypothetical protein n=1 Tax=Allorhizobium undicola TaxID=78527 RepID=UPI000481B936|nr:hypothetical protein [Allorhizobium undicola]